jgi:hypothetical protein
MCSQYCGNCYWCTYRGYPNGNAFCINLNVANEDGKVVDPDHTGCSEWRTNEWAVE